MPQFGAYPDGTSGVSTDEIVVKRSGTGTVRLPLNKLPVSEAATAAFADQNAFNTFQENTLGALSQKEAILTFVNASRVGNTVTIDTDLQTVVGQLSDGKSFMAFPAASSFTLLGPNLSTANIVGTISSAGPNNPTNGWAARGRAVVTGTAAANNQIKVMLQPRVRYPETTTSLYGGFRIVLTWSSTDTNANAVGFAGLLQTVPAAGTAPNAYTGSRWGFMHDPSFGDQNLKLYNGGSLIQDLGASFPGNGNGTNAYIADIWCRPFPNYGITWSITNVITGATASGTTTNFSLGTFDPIVGVIRDSQATATAPVLHTLGIFGGAFTSFVVGDSTLLVPSPLTLTGNTTLTKATYGDVEVFANSATPITLTVDPTGYGPGDRLYGTNNGVGSVSFAAGSGVTINQHADVSASVPQYKGWNLVCTATNTWTRLA